MRKQLLSLLFLFHALSYAQIQEATIHFNDGTSVFGYGEIKDDWKIKFRVSKDVEPDIWTDTMVSGITFHGFEMDVEYRYMYEKEDQRYPLLLEVLTEGEVTLYADVNSSNMILVAGFTRDSFSLSGYQLPETTKLYVNRRSEFVIYSLQGGFKRKVRTYFADCPQLLEKVNNNEFGRPQIIELVNYYNDYCTDWQESKN